VQLITKVPFPLVEVIWRDADCGSGWERISEGKPDSELCTTTGYLIEDHETHVVIASSFHWDKSAEEYATNARMAIPRGMIQKMRVHVRGSKS